MIEVSGLTKRFRDRTAVDDLTFDIPRGEVVGLLGPNGAGKTTTLRLLTGFLPASSGSVRVAGFDVFEQPMEARRHIGYLPEVPPLYDAMTVRGQLRFAAELKGIGRALLAGEVDRVSRLTGVDGVLDRLT
ncbi:MAG: transporter, partial [Anaeromyxobacteraceae bacterium]|nr:transporter [Anaeromyxobacteraceae bacterium]